MKRIRPLIAVLTMGLLVVSTAGSCAAEVIPAEPVAPSETAAPSSDTAVSSADADTPATSPDPVDADAATATNPANDGRVIETIRERFANGEIKSERHVTLSTDFNYVNHGDYRRWDEEGNLIADGQYVDGLAVGAWRRIHDDSESELFGLSHFANFTGPFLSVATFKAGKLDGTWTITDRDKRVVFEIQLLAGLRDGQTVFHAADGSVRECEFRDGMLDGSYRETDAEGNVVTQLRYVAGREVELQTENYVSTRKKAEAWYLTRRFVLTAADDWWNATLATYNVQSNVEAIKHGDYTRWYETGELKTTGTFYEGRPSGKFTWWHENRQLAMQGEYVDGQQAGVWTWWHPNGMKASQGHYQEGRPAGLWMTWDKQGQLLGMQELTRLGEQALTATALPEADEPTPAEDEARHTFSLEPVPR